MSTSSSTLCPNCCALLEVLRFVIQIWYAISYILHCTIYSRELGIVHSKRSISLENTKGIKNYFLSFLSIITYVSFTFLSLSLSLFSCSQGITVNDASYSASQQIPSRDDLALFDSNTGFYTSGAQGLLPRHTDIVPAEDIQTSTNTMSYNETHFVNQLTAFDNFSSHAPGMFP